MQDQKRRRLRFAVYNRFELGLKTGYSRLKSFLLSPLVRLLAACGVSPNLISFAGFATAGVLYWRLAVLESREGAGAWLLVYLFFDNLDGSLAEWLGPAEGGQVVDNFYDLLSLLLIVLAVSSSGMVLFPTACLFLMLYFWIIAGGFVLGANDLYPLMIRPRVVLFAGFLINVLAGRDLLDLEWWVRLTIVAQLLSVVSIGRLWYRHRGRLRFPTRLEGITARTRLLALVSLLAVAAAVACSTSRWALAAPVSRSSAGAGAGGSALPFFASSTKRPVPAAVPDGFRPGLRRRISLLN